MDETPSELAITQPSEAERSKKWTITKLIAKIQARQDPITTAHAPIEGLEFFIIIK